MMVFIALTLAVIGLFLLIWFLSQGAIYVPSADDRKKDIIQAVKQLNAERIVDLGSGDGKLVIALAQLGYSVDGVEIQPWLVWRSRRAIRRLGLQDKATIYWGSLWKSDVSKYNTVLLYAMPHIMARLERKLQSELPVGSAVVSNFFKFPQWKPEKTIGDVRIYNIK